jgi:hypothetical protein
LLHIALLILFVESTRVGSVAEHLGIDNTSLRIDGSLDWIGPGGTVEGWAWDDRRPNVPIKVDIYDDKVLLATIPADRPLEGLDLQLTSWGDGSGVPASGKSLAGFGLQLMAWGDGSGVPTSGKSLAIAGLDNNGLLHIRTFDAGGHYTDTDETKIARSRAWAISDLKQRLPSLLPPHLLTDAEKSQLISRVTSIVGQTYVIVGLDNNGLLHIRTFDAGGRCRDTDETRLLGTEAVAISALKQRLPRLLPPHVLTGAEKAQLISEVTLIIGQISREKRTPSGIGRGDHGFLYTIPEQLKDGKKHRIRVKVSGSDGELPGSPVTVSFPKDPDYKGIAIKLLGWVMPVSVILIIVRLLFTKWLGGQPTARDITGWLAFMLPFVGLLAWFRVTDVYHSYYFETQSNWIYLIYNGCRTVYSLYLIWLLYYVGSILLHVLLKKGVHLDLRLVDEVVLCFYAGAAIAGAAGFLLGNLSLYYYWILTPATLLLLSASFRSFGSFLKRIGDWRRDAWARGDDAAIALARLFALGATIFIVLLLLILRALPPGGHGDYYTHYLYYYKHVIESHGLRPNELWYHFYQQKGASPVFWSILLTDLQAPEMVSFSFVLIAGLAVFSLVRRWCGDSVLPMAAMVAYFSTYVLPQFPGDLVVSGYPMAWGEFQKQHELLASLIASLAWLILVIPRCVGWTLRAWSLFASLVTANVVLFQPTAYPLVLALLGLGAIGWAIHKQWRMMVCFGTSAVTSTVVLASILVLNYRATGLAADTPMRFFWKYADQARFSEVWSPYLMILLQEGSSPQFGGDGLRFPPGMGMWQFARSISRYDHLSKIVILPNILIVTVWSIIAWLLVRGGRPRFGLTRALLIVPGFLAVCIPLACASGQYVSAFRYFSFTVFFINLVGFLTWASLIDLLPWRPTFRKVVPVASGILACSIALTTFVHIPTDELTECLLFSIGRKNLANIYEYRGGFSDDVFLALSTLPAGSRVYSFDKSRICMIPDREVESFVSYALGKHWHEIMFESPERSRSLLQKQGLDYFLVNLGYIEDIIQYSPLFCPSNIANYLQVAWNEGDLYLLTWPAPGTHPLSESFLARYRHSSMIRDFSQLYDRVRLIYESNKGKPYPIRRDPSLPPVPGWQ